VQTTTRVPSDYRALSRQVREAGLLEPRPGYYVPKISLTLGGFALGWVAFFVVGNSWATIGIAAFLAVMFTQVLFVGHDAGHQQIFGTRRANWWLGLIVGDLLTGLSFGWWVPKHNAHHAHPNQIGRDPDIGSGVIAFTPEDAERRRGLGRTLARGQAWAFFPLLVFEAAALHVASTIQLAGRRDRGAIVEAGLLLAHAAAYLTVVFLVLSPGRAVAFIAVQQGLFGLYLGCTFAPNHKGMALIDRDSDMSFVNRQVLTARNITGGRFTTFAYGGLNYQIEHHLFPSMPRSNLGRAQAIIRAFCIAHDLPYQEDSVVGSYRRVLGHLHTVGAVCPLAAT
jgi:fatty acid desaturase